jgi:N-acetylglucosaminyl-diphospho-decaprenol L-rhamnosyltransferase
MKILTVILNYKTADMTIKSATYAIKAMAPFGDDWGMVIVDNHSNDGSYEKIQDEVKKHQDENWKKIQVIASERNGGFGAGNNIAIRKVLSDENPPDYIYILNSDAFPSPEAIGLLASHLEKNPQVGIAGSYIHGVDNQPHTTAFRFPTLISEFEDSVSLGLISRLCKNYIVPIGIPDTNLDVDWLAGASMLLRCKMLDEIGIFDEQFFLYFEETDLCKRARNANWKTTYIRDSHVAHIGSASTGMKKWQHIPSYWLDSRRYYFCKNHGKIYFHLTTAIRLIGGMSWQIRRIIQKKVDPSPPGFLKDLFLHWIQQKK